MRGAKTSFAARVARIHWLLLMVLLSLLMISTGPRAQTTGNCPMPQRSEGTWGDYRLDRGGLHVVERRHFTRRVEMLISGESTSQPGPDIAYTLNKYPNHHRALISLSRLSKRQQVAQVVDMAYSVDCYFERALGFAPNDTVARLIFAQHLSTTGRVDQASQQVALTGNYAGDNALTHYNMGLVAFELKDFAVALTQAHRAQGLGLARSGLRELLQKEGHWSDPAKDASPPAAATADPPPIQNAPASAPLPEPR